MRRWKSRAKQAPDPARSELTGDFAKDRIKGGQIGQRMEIWMKVCVLRSKVKVVCSRMHRAVLRRKHLKGKKRKECTSAGSRVVKGFEQMGISIICGAESSWPRHRPPVLISFFWTACVDSLLCFPCFMKHVRVFECDSIIVVPLCSDDDPRDRKSVV